jgi:CDGSH-type Zn-finger protein
MKLAIIILSLLVITAIAVDRRHSRRHLKHRKVSTRAETVLLCDAGSSKTKCMCFDPSTNKTGSDASNDTKPLGLLATIYSHAASDVDYPKDITAYVGVIDELKGKVACAATV